MMRLQYLGEAQIITMSVIDFLAAANEEEAKRSGVAKYIEGMSKSAFEELLQKCGDVYTCAVPPLSFLYIPAGFLVVEKASKGQVVTSARKSVFLKGDSAQANMLSTIPYFDKGIAVKIKELADMLAKDPP